MLIESHEAGYIAKKLRGEGETVSVDLAIAVFCEEVSRQSPAITGDEVSRWERLSPSPFFASAN
jgi:pyruvate/2-oxoglutarate dehydrogenase complex dihydrolipoamide acyltransferase (E2) component